jgi:hypothetical protein
MMAELAPKNHAIILCTLNAKYIHASLGLRYLLANMKLQAVAHASFMMLQ